jgi:hypothetical protein
MAQSRQVQDQPSLYARLGGVYSIATVVDDVIDRVMSDPRLNAKPQVRCAGTALVESTPSAIVVG